MSNLIEAVHWTKIPKLKQYIKGTPLFKLVWSVFLQIYQSVKGQIEAVTFAYLRRHMCENGYENTIWQYIKEVILTLIAPE